MGLYVLALVLVLVLVLVRVRVCTRTSTSTSTSSSTGTSTGIHTRTRTSTSTSMSTSTSTMFLCFSHHSRPGSAKDAMQWSQEKDEATQKPVTDQLVEVGTRGRRVEVLPNHVP